MCNPEQAPASGGVETDELLALERMAERTTDVLAAIRKAGKHWDLAPVTVEGFRDEFGALGEYVIALCAELTALRARVEAAERADHDLETAWTLLANVSDGNWIMQSIPWQTSVAAWRDRVMPGLSARAAHPEPTPAPDAALREAAQLVVAEWEAPPREERSLSPAIAALRTALRAALAQEEGR